MTGREVAEQAAEHFTRLESDQRYAGHLGRVELSREVLRWARDTFGDEATVASSMGDEVLVELIAQTVPELDVFFLDTGFHFPETIATRDHYAGRVRLRTILPLLTVAEQNAEHGERLFDRDPDRCCAIRKVEPLNRALAGRTAWVTGMRRVDAPTRTDITLVGWDDKRGMVKINPIAAWDDDDVDRFAFEEDVFLNPLREQGYPSIGCQPCTRRVAPGEDPRAGRWAGKNKTECGLHT
ncbi:phosphoadenosine phosphosulfate reductase [Tessaracoccus bendigoensis DSM 12906]|uniref:Adenosine 5'-phosphosulfate reductase n=1 Tax=Tessaracoccus bendigoensis DSM 12906 TaxID=1123357 RepID=A0A1M6LTD8_9ACTN|nr:phosphoadenylyl-sulfate reductase [Tessaracoccus bendigoensis]SHJ74487.1 phosphoadenosine phosphosulfate reductase [Tessaracoccus bendigoensis DSM 12906]